MKKLLQTFLLSGALCLGMNASAQILDGSFEDGNTWTEASTNFGTPLCDAGCGDCGGPCFARTGSFYAWFGGAGGAIETGSVEQSITIPTGTTASVDMYVKVASPGPGLVDDRLEVSLDGTILATVSTHDSVAYMDYTLLSVDVSSAADGGMHTLRIEGFQTSTTSANLLVDDAILLVDGNTTSLFEDVMEPKFRVYPNPAVDAINLTFGELNGDAIVSIVSIDGSVVSKQVVSDVFNKNFAFSTQDMQNGVYLVEVDNGGVVTSQRIVVSK